MLRRRLLLGALAGVLLLIPATPALAGWYVVTLDRSPEQVQAGVPFSIGFTVLMHHEALSGLVPKVTAMRTNASGGTIHLAAPAPAEQVTVEARPQGAPGPYLATLTLPSPGRWEWQIAPFGQGEDVQRMSAIDVGVASPQQQPQMAPASADALATSRGVLRWTGLALVLVALVLAAGTWRTGARARRVIGDA